jgi:hypothetical protein
VETLAVFIDLSSPIYQRGFERNFEFTGSARNHHLNRRFSTKDWFPDDILYWAIACLGHDDYRPFTMDPSLNFRIIDYICRTDPKEASRMDQNLVDELSDMAALNTISTNIQCHVSLNRKYTHKMSDEDTEKRGNWIKKSNSAKGPAVGNATAKYLDEFCTKYPWPKGTKNEQWLKQATASRFSLNRFWQAFRSQWAKKLGENGVWPSSITEDLDLMRAHESEEYRAEVEAERDEVRHLEYQRRLSAQNQSVTPIEAQTVWGGREWRFAIVTSQQQDKATEEVRGARRIGTYCVGHSSQDLHSAQPYSRQARQHDTFPPHVPILRRGITAFFLMAALLERHDRCRLLYLAEPGQCHHLQTGRGET